MIYRSALAAYEVGEKKQGELRRGERKREKQREGEADGSARRDEERKSLLGGFTTAN